MNEKELNDMLQHIKMGSNVISSIIKKSTPLANEFVNILASGVMQTHSPGTEFSTMSEEPSCNIQKVGDYSKILINLPGVLKEDITINVQNQLIILHATVKFKKENWQHLNNIQYQKTIKLNETIIQENISSEFENGILYIIYKHNDKNEFNINID